MPRASRPLRPGPITVVQMTLEFRDIVGAVVVGSPWNLHHDIAYLREWVAQIEGRVDILIVVFVKSPRSGSTR